MSQPARRQILVVEDEAKIASLLLDYLAQAGYAARAVGNGRAALSDVREHAPDLVLLDILLPGMDGMAVCRAIRQFSQVPIIMLTARIEEVDRLLGLELGADDYICKPFSPREVVGRINALFRRQDWLTGGTGDASGINIDRERMAARLAGRPLDLTPAEFRLLLALIERPGRIFSRDQLLREMRMDDRDSTDRAVDSHVKNLRKKIAEVMPEAAPLRSVYGVGYKWEWDEPPPDSGAGN